MLGKDGEGFHAQGEMFSIGQSYSPFALGIPQFGFCRFCSCTPSWTLPHISLLMGRSLPMFICEMLAAPVSLQCEHSPLDVNWQLINGLGKPVGVDKV